jgi:hypothetical protein
MAFGKPMILIASTRYEIGRWDKKSWTKLNQNLQLIAKKEYNVIGANNIYDQKYIEHFTGIQTEYISSYCGYADAIYTGKKNEFILGPKHPSEKGRKVMQDIKKVLENKGIHIKQNRDLNGGASGYYPTLAAYKGVIMVPYRVSLMSFFEFYKMGVPIFVPSLDFMMKLQKDLVMHQLSWNCVSWAGNLKCEDGSAIHGVQDNPDPNLVRDGKSNEHWIPYADYYTFPHIQYFDDYDDLAEKISSVNLKNVHKQMMHFNEERREKLDTKWRKILGRTSSNDVRAFETWDEAMEYYYPESPDIGQKC